MSTLFDLSNNTNLYKILGVEKGASEAAIKSAYKKLVILYHPDKNPNGAEKFKELCFAYSILSDVEQRLMYDNKTLKSHLHRKAKEYDPAMDLNVELSPEKLRSFVENLQKETDEKQSRQSQFEERRLEEMKRREVFGMQNPNFRMPGGTERYTLSASRPSASASPSVESYTMMDKKTTADLMNTLDEFDETNKAKRRVYADDIEENVADLKSAPCNSSYKAQMLNQFRSQRREEGRSTVDVPTPEPNVLRGLDEKKFDFIKESPSAGPSYSAHAKKVASSEFQFDYGNFVAKGYHDGGVVKDAILSDALGDYDPAN